MSTPKGCSLNVSLYNLKICLLMSSYS